MKNPYKLARTLLEEAALPSGGFASIDLYGDAVAGLSTVLSILPFVCIWFVVRDMLNALIAGDIALASRSSTYAWMAADFSILSILLYFIALCCTHLAAFRTATNMKKAAMH